MGLQSYNLLKDNRSAIVRASVGDSGAAWLDSADINTITESSGSVSQIDDKFVRGNNATQGVGAQQPTTNASTQNGLNLVDYDGGDDMALPAAIHAIANGPNTIFIIAKRTTENGTFDTLLALTEAGATRTGIRFQITAGSIRWASSSGTGATTNTGNTNTNFQIMAAFRSGVNLSLSVDNGTASTSTLGSDEPGVDLAKIGATGTSNRLVGSIAEIAIYDRALLPIEINDILTESAIKWRLTLA